MMNPVSPSTTTSALPPPLEQTTGSPQAMYSKMELEQPSTARRGSVSRTPTCAVRRTPITSLPRLDELKNTGAHQVLVLHQKSPRAPLHRQRPADSSDPRFGLHLCNCLAAERNVPKSFSGAILAAITTLNPSSDSRAAGLSGRDARVVEAVVYDPAFSAGHRMRRET